jgi:hypothetical protein
MRSLVTAVLLGLGVVGVSAALPEQALANGHWHGNYRGGPVRYVSNYSYCSPVVTPVCPPYVAPPLVTPTVVAPPPAIAPYTSFSVGTTNGCWSGPVWHSYHGRYYHR